MAFKKIRLNRKFARIKNVKRIRKNEIIIKTLMDELLIIKFEGNAEIIRYEQT